ncbi:hypothetical protein [Chryseobacterium culicis]|uniref:hypothetical protein n=1 Tax=Chryseobacterium culicis TaxID=680127 RepID=UPI00258FBE85|nr:hypothetical protein [Chryseobacterium culicis]
MNVLSQNYWKNDLFGVWGFYWSEKNMFKILENKLVFIEKYIKICIKYGINIPIDFCDSNNLDIVKDLFFYRLNKTLTKDKEWYMLFKLYNNGNMLYPIFPCLLYIKNDKNIFSDNYIGVEELTTYNQENITKKNFSELIKIWTYINVDDTNPTITFYLNTNAFFSELESYSYEQGKTILIDNSDLAYLNTTRFNSFIRDLTILFFEFGADEFDFSDEKGISELYDDIYLKIKGEVVFYEDIYDLLPEEHKYKPFEEIKVELDNTNYKRYVENKNN